MDEATTPFWKRPKHQLIAAVVAGQFLYFALAAIATRNAYISSVLAIVFTFGYGLAILGWCRLDSRERGYPLSPRFAYAVVIFGTLSLIFYLFRSRGFAGGIRAAALFFASVIGLFIIDSIVAVIVIILMSVITGTPLPE